MYIISTILILHSRLRFYFNRKILSIDSIIPKLKAKLHFRSFISQKKKKRRNKNYRDITRLFKIVFMKFLQSIRCKTKKRKMISSDSIMNMEMMKPFTELERGTVVGSSTLASLFIAVRATILS